MFKDKLNYRLLNFAIFAILFLILYHTGPLWMGIVGKVWEIIFPFFIAFVVAYALYPFLQFMISKKIPKAIAVFIILAIIFGVFAFMVALIFPLLFGQLSSLFNGILAFVKEITTNYDINLGPLQQTLTSSFNDIISGLGKYVSDGAVSVINNSMNVLSIFVIAFAAAIYLLVDMDKIRSEFKSFLLSKNEKSFNYFKILDTEMKNYLTGFIKIVGITLVEYTVAFLIIGHPNAILLGFLAAIATLIPYFGGMITNVIAAITAFVISPGLFIRTIICFFVLSTLDGYVINPFVYGKTNEIHPLAVIFAVFAGGALFGVLGIIISLPLAIIVISTYKFYRGDITEKIEDIKGKK
ncbi:MAG: AI-2E family transporter [Bacilli bacterium]|nr:AI-2E family transporter [Bacilli bacterium]